jgi:hypothetical protein
LTGQREPDNFSRDLWRSPLPAESLAALRRWREESALPIPSSRDLLQAELTIRRAFVFSARRPAQFNMLDFYSLPLFSKLEERLRDVLRLGLYQLFFLGQLNMRRSTKP